MNPFIFDPSEVETRSLGEYLAIDFELDPSHLKGPRAHVAETCVIGKSCDKGPKTLTEAAFGYVLFGALGLGLYLSVMVCAPLYWRIR